MITRRVEYVRWCAGPDCNTAEAESWTTRKDAEEAAERDGWVRCTYKRWLCPGCAARAKLVASLARPTN